MTGGFQRDVDQLDYPPKTDDVTIVPLRSCVRMFSSQPLGRTETARQTQYGTQRGACCVAVATWRCSRRGCCVLGIEANPFGSRPSTDRGGDFESAAAVVHQSRLLGGGSGRNGRQSVRKPMGARPAPTATARPERHPTSLVTGRAPVVRC
uniref:Uncharacterized protein n=1 Tax=Plectus sambesii TaxID=2011161 RepID=A0A914XC07_9BILA